MPGDAETRFLEATRRFAEEKISPAAAEWALGAHPAAELFDQAAEIGLNRVEVPEAQGGLGLSYRVKAKACEILAGADFGFAMSVVNTHNVAARLVATASPTVCERHLSGLVLGAVQACTALTEPAGGSDLAAISTRAIQVEQGWRLTGEKSWIVNARRAGLAIVYAQCGAQGDANSVAAFVVDLEVDGVGRFPIDAPISQTSIGTGRLTFQDVHIPEDALLFPPGKAFKSILTEINGARAYVGAMACGMMESALCEARAYGAVRHSFGRALQDHQAWRLPIAEAETELAAAKALVEEAVLAVDAGRDAQLLAAQAKVSAVQLCQRHLPHLQHALGAEGLRAERCVSRHLGAAQMASLTDGSTTILLERIARLTRLSTEQAKQQDQSER